MKVETIDARGGDYVIAEGKALRDLIRGKINGIQASYRALLERMNNELSSKEEAVTLMVAMGDSVALNERAMFFKACVDRCAFLEKELRELNTLGSSFQPGCNYRITITDASRFGI